MKNREKNTKKAFASMDDTVRKLRRTDPIQFDVLYNEWRRMRETRQDTNMEDLRRERKTTMFAKAFPCEEEGAIECIDCRHTHHCDIEQRRNEIRDAFLAGLTHRTAVLT